MKDTGATDKRSRRPGRGRKSGNEEAAGRRQGFHRFDDIRAAMDQVLAASVADETEVVWLERRHGRVSSDAGDPGFCESPRLSVMVRVAEAGRLGWFRTDTPDANQLESGVRQALAMAKGERRLKRRPVLPAADDEYRAPRRLLDHEISRLQLGPAKDRLAALAGDDEEARLTWVDTRLVIQNSHGLRRSAASTEATLHFASGRGPGAGYAAASARRLASLEPETLRARARRLRGHGEAAPLPQGTVPVVLSPEATVQWLSILNAYAFSGRSFLDGTSFLARHRNIQVFDRKLNLRDDGTAPGLPFPFDFEGSRKRPLDLIVDGQPSTPALTQAQGAQAGLEPTAHSVGGQDALFTNLFLLPGEASQAELLAAAEGGIRVGWLESAECFEPSQLKVRMVARGARRIAGGELAAPLPDFVWHESLLGALARLRAVGTETVVLATPTTPLGGISAPALVLEESGGFAPFQTPAPELSGPSASDRGSLGEGAYGCR